MKPYSPITDLWFGWSITKMLLLCPTIRPNIHELYVKYSITTYYALELPICRLASASDCRRWIEDVYANSLLVILTSRIGVSSVFCKNHPLCFIIPCIGVCSGRFGTLTHTFGVFLATWPLGLVTALSSSTFFVPRRLSVVYCIKYVGNSTVL